MAPARGIRGHVRLWRGVSGDDLGTASFAV